MLPAPATPVESSSQARSGGRPHSACASRALSPAGTRKTSTPALRAPNVFCFTPPIGPTVPSSEISPVAATLCRVDVAAELLHHVEREGEAGGRAADVAGVDPDPDGSFDVEPSLERRRRSIARSGSCGSATVLIVASRPLPVAAGDLDHVARALAAPARVASARPGSAPGARRRRRSRRRAASLPAAGAPSWTSGR